VELFVGRANERAMNELVSDCFDFQRCLFDSFIMLFDRCDDDDDDETFSFL